MNRTNIVGKIIGWSKREISDRRKFLSIAFAAALFIFFIPYLLYILSSIIDSLFLLPKILPKPFNFIPAIILIGFGLPFAEWTVYIQYKIGKGTPWPYASPNKLLITGPYKYTRNPMFLGAMIYYFGIGLLINSIAFLIVLFPIVIIPLIMYYKFIEEVELLKRYGEEYMKYKKKTSFLLPKFL